MKTFEASLNFTKKRKEGKKNSQIVTLENEKNTQIV